MERIYASLIVKGKKKFTDVPSELKEDVKQLLIDWGYEKLITE